MKWELYDIYDFDGSDWVQVGNADDGWELASVAPLDRFEEQHFILFFKKPVEEPKPRVEVFGWQQEPPTDQEVSPAVMGSYMRPVPVRKSRGFGTFQCWGSDVFESGEGCATFSTAIVTMDDGSVVNPPVDLVEFVK